MSKNQNLKILLEKIVEYEPKYFHYAGVRNIYDHNAVKNVSQCFKNETITVMKDNLGADI
jgi:hypothetical protein